ncbi:hypothetical protein SteCoe_25302 [Stentor coeruleus]|uniref:dual-specificity kinase n=1 Tax=Stentor coeruleus TaxID=5963 RepID=A0A1R2BFM4_9CILI|nr:hypothetical protein SteCoe_25302 [Stentor coeruleus]
MKPKLTIKTKEQSKKIILDTSTPKHKYSTSLLTPKSFISISGSTRARPSFSSFLSPNASKSLLAAKHNYTISHQFPISPSSPRLVKMSKMDAVEDKIMWKSFELPISHEEVLKGFKQHLTQFELEEILSYTEIFFIGIGANKVKSTSSNNNGFDDDEGGYRIICGDHIAYRYEVLQILGSGSFGKVVKAFDYKSKQEIALKIIKNKPRFHEQAREEIEILNYLKIRDPGKNYCLVQFMDNFQFRNHICLTFELLSINLYQYIKLNNYQPVPMNIIKRFALQILQALRLMDRYKVVHCDLKPENILLKTSDSNDIRVIDLGSACFYEKRIYTYIQSRYYRAPEVILGLDYSTAIDMWSFGCILTELFIGRPIFPGENETEQIQCMIEVLGSPPLKVINKASRRHLYFEVDGRPKIQPNSKGRKRMPNTRPLKEILKGGDDGFKHLISQCFEWDQLKRVSPDEALLHPWFIEVNNAQNKFKHSKTQSEAVLKQNKLFVINESKEGFKKNEVFKGVELGLRHDE